ncbi:hypothetical protein JVU11DRAFT_5228 [Chiua virens]|nr:hypothetical protein JVU11DRAFT_5228 [Chiua virens]
MQLAFLDLPLDTRLIIYDLILADHQAIIQSSQPLNAHILFLHTCRQTYYDAGDTFRRYVSLRNEFQMERFYHYVSSAPETALHVRWADIANDGRIVEILRTGQSTPASQLYHTLAKLTSLETLRVFDVRHYHPFPLNVPHMRYHLDFEGAIYPLTTYKDGEIPPHLTTYELHLDPSTRVSPFDRIPSICIRSLRLSGDCHINHEASFPALRHLTIRSVTSNTFDRIKFSSVFANAHLESFTHAQGHRLAFEMRNAHLESLVNGPGFCLRKLVLLGSTRLTTPVIASCLRNLPTLEYLALSLVTVNELRENFILALGPSLRTFKLQIIHAWYVAPLFDEQRIICNSLEELILTRESLLDTVYVSFHSRIMSEDGREERWKHIADTRHLTLKIGPWEDNEET